MIKKCKRIYTLFGDGTVPLKSATAFGEFPLNRIFYKTNENGFKSDHVEMAEGAADATTINFVCNIIGISQSSIMKLAPDTLLTNYGIIYGN